MKKSINKKIYVAYGSNLNIGQMSYRCPDAEVLASGYIEGYKLAFSGWTGHGVATIIPAEGCRVPVGLWTISKRDEVALDRYEGWPHLYRKENIEVVLDNGQKISAMVYIMNENCHGEKMIDACPTSSYYNTIYLGYRDFNLNTEVLAAAAKPYINVEV